MSTVNGASFDRDLLASVATDPALAHIARLLMLAAERAGFDGVAEFDPGELGELLAMQGSRGRSPSSRTGRLVREAVNQGFLRAGSRAVRVLLDTDLIQPHGIPRAGERYGLLTLTGQTRVGAWATTCSCGQVRVFDERHLVAGIVGHCGDSVRHRLAVAA
ncbi:hypothetical protein ASD62_05755 [Phycicoccus sp. Root563]|uniref:hypothetical protein n=1 Tax=Phycicoccus sp. Root563 TaxID=1736562 RepID=UPI0007036340|nr:hypothetical protein [Phycicoccus sp. Root563]KQZ88881.1 hypothetical protein ASD62_05755 [Phycicoccus sp. Root563]